jgi:hypothetical protein
MDKKTVFRTQLTTEIKTNKHTESTHFILGKLIELMFSER